MLGRGLAFSSVLVGARLALPLPLTRVVAVSSGAASGPPVILLCGAFVGLALVAGLAEHHQRLAFAHFVGRTVGDVRSEALARASANHAPAGLTAQVLGDCLRVKLGLKGLLNHITVNGLLMLGVCLALMVADPFLGAVAGIGSVLMLVVAVGGARHIGRLAADHRSREVTLAGSVHELIGEGTVSSSALASLRHTDARSGAADIAITRWEGLTTWLTTLILAVAAASVLLIGGQAVRDGRLTPATLVAVAAYLLVLQGPATRCVRQVTRTASLQVSARELGLVLLDPETSGPN